jgi:hypothetical protein
MKNSILNIDVSCFESCTGTVPVKINLLTWLTSEKHRAKIENLRSIQDEDLQVIIKKSLPATTPSGLFSYRDTEHLIQHSGFIAFDIDKKDNKHISFEGLREQISHIASVAYCGLSCRGLGLWGLVPIPKSTPEEHKQRFASLARDFKAFDINLDQSGSDICRLRIYSWDDQAYFNHNASLYTRILKPQAKKTTLPAYTDTRERVESIISQIKENKIDITQDYKEDWLKIASALANEFSESGRGYFHSVSMYHAKYNEGETDRMFDNVLKHDYKITIGSFFKIASDYGIKLYNEVDSRKDDKIKVINQKAENIQITTIQKPAPAPAKQGIWSNEIEELEQFFSSVKLPDTIRLNPCSMITDINLFIKSHMDIVKAQNGNKRYIPYLERLQELKAILKTNLN